ncbi:MAG: LexA family protein [Culicoidibacterales bacterium]
MSTVGERLKNLRQNYGVTAEKISNEFKISKSAIYNYENDHREMSYEVLNKFANLYGVPIDYIINGTIYEKKNQMRVSSLKLSILGKIPAGMPIEAITTFDGYVYIPETIHKKYGQDLFALRVIGDSMSKIIPNNAIAVIKKQSVVENGSIVVVLVDNQDATLKRFFRLDEETVVLKPDSYSEEYIPEVINLKKQNIVILGKLVWSCTDEF